MSGPATGAASGAAGNGIAAMEEPKLDAASTVRRLLTRLGEAVLVIQDGFVQLANPRAEKLLGYSEAGLGALPLEQLIHPEDWPRIEKSLCPQAERSQDQDDRPIQLLTRSGEPRWVEVQSEAIRWQERAATLCFLKDALAGKGVEDRFRRAVNSTSEGFMMLDRALTITEVNPALLMMSGYAPQELIGSRADRLYRQDQVEFYSASRDHMSFEASLITKDGQGLPILFKRSSLRDETGAVSGYMFFLTDLTELKATQEELRKAEQRYRSMYRNAVQGMFQSELSGKLIRVNPAYARILGYGSPDEMLRIKSAAAELYFDSGERQRMLKALKRTGVLKNYEVKLRRKDGKPVWALANYRLNRDEAAGGPIIEGILVDHTRQKRLEEELRRGREKYRRRSLRDNLTGLYNTRFLYQALEALIAASRESARPFALLFVDMDNFKRVVDTHGHLNGSQALREVARTIKSLLKKPCFAVAYGGDEFVVVLPGYDKDRARSKAESIRAKMKRTSYLAEAGLAVRLSASFGLASYPEDALDITGLLGRADKALFRVKQKAKGSIGEAS